LKDDRDLKELAGKLDAAAGDKSFKSFLNKPMGMGKFQEESGVPVRQDVNMDGIASKAMPAVQEDDEELFMARMRT